MVGEFFAVIEEQIGRPKCVLDLACADPSACPAQTCSRANISCLRRQWLPHQLFESAFRVSFPFAKAIQQDVFVDPQLKRDCAFSSKKLIGPKRAAWCHRSTPAFNVDVTVLTLPATDLARHHSLENYHTQLVEKAVQGQDFHFEKIRVGDELIFFIRKGS